MEASEMTVKAAVESHGHFAHMGNPDDAAEAWMEAGFDAHEVDEWLRARCFSPGAARDLADGDVSAQLAALKTGAGAGDYVDTVGFKVSVGDLDVVKGALKALEAGGQPTAFSYAG
jgi:hypothetical protein